MLRIIISFSILCIIFGISGCTTVAPVREQVSTAREAEEMKTSEPEITENSPLKGRIICVDPGHGGTAAYDNYRIGPSGEREEWIDLRVGLILKELLEARGAKVLMTRTEDVDVPLKDRGLLAIDNKADAFVSIHHNAIADPEVNVPIVYYHGYASENQAGVQLGRRLLKRLAEAMYPDEVEMVLASDHVLFAGSGAAVLRHSYGIPGVLGEASFFTDPAEEERLKDPEYNRKEAVAYLKALEDFFTEEIPPIAEKYSSGHIEPLYRFTDEDGRHKYAAKWKEYYELGRERMNNDSTEARKEAYKYFTLSARSFTDSPVARECHLNRARILESFGEKDAAATEVRRAEELYVPVE